MRESSIEKRLCSAVKDRGGLALKLPGCSLAGVPDRLVLLPGGKVGFVETKARGGKPRPLQLKRHERLREMGFPVFVLDATKAIARCLDAI